MFLELNSKGLYHSSRKEKESYCLVIPSSTKREIRHFHVVVVHRRLRSKCTKKRAARAKMLFCQLTTPENTIKYHNRDGEWYLEKRGSRKILAGSRNLGSVFDKSRSLVFAWFVFTFFESRNFLPKSLGLGFLTRISASRRVSDFTIRHPS